MMALHLVEGDDAARLAAVQELMYEYAAMPHTALRWTSSARDIAALPAPFLPPKGRLVLVTDGEEPIGCGALLALSPTIAELKRLYVRPAARGRGAGDALTRGLIDHAAEMGFTHVRLDTAPELTAALALYRRLGFTPIPPYRDGLLPDGLCFERLTRLPSTPTT